MNICINKSPTYPTLYSFKCFFLAACCKKKKKETQQTRSRCQASPRLLNGGPDSLSACQFVSLLFSLLFLGGFTRFRALCESLASVCGKVATVCATACCQMHLQQRQQQRCGNNCNVQHTTEKMSLSEAVLINM